MKQEIVIDVKEVLDTLGVKNVRESGREVNYSCPGSAHRYGDSRPSAYMRSTYPYPYHCFGCGQQGTVVDFVSEFLGIDRAKSWRWLGERFGFDSAYDPSESIAETLNRILGPKSKPQPEALTNPEIKAHGFVPVVAVAPANDYLRNRGLTQDTITQFELQWDSRTGRIAIPIRDRMGRLIGFKARDITGEKEPKYLVLGDRKQYRDYGFTPYNSSLVLFAHNMCNDINHTAVVVEGEFNAMKIRQAGYTAVLGLPTAGMSTYQSCMIREQFEEVILYLDSDEAGIKGMNSALNALQGACKVRVVAKHDRDAMDSTEADIRSLITEATNPLTQTLTKIGA